MLALRVAGLAAKELGRLDEGLGYLRRALELTREAADAYGAAQVRMNLVGLLTARGDVTEALAHAREAETVLHREDADRLAANKACALARAGRLDEAHDVAARALPRLREGSDPAVLNGLLTNLGLARALRGDLDGAEKDLAEAVAVGETAGLGHQTAMAKANLAFVVSRRGDVPRALRLFAEAQPHLTGERLAQSRLDQAETLIMAGLPGEARPVLTSALDAAKANGYGCDIADGFLLLAHAELADGNPERCTLAAERARALFAEQERTGWMLLAEHLLLRARWASGERSAVLLGSAEAAAARLESGGWADAADEARIVAARVALSLGRPAGHLLARIGRSRGSAASQIAAWHAVALERAARADHDGAVEAVEAGLRVAEDHAEALGALDLRARAAGLAGELSELGLGLARSAAELLAVEERRRAIARPVRVRPPRDPGRAAALTALRVLSVEHTAGVARGVPSVLAQDVADLEAKVRARTRHRPSGARPRRSPGVGAIAAALGDRALVEIVAIGSGLHAVTVAGGEARRHRARLPPRRRSRDRPDPLRRAPPRRRRRPGTAVRALRRGPPPRPVPARPAAAAHRGQGARHRSRPGSCTVCLGPRCRPWPVVRSRSCRPPVPGCMPANPAARTGTSCSWPVPTSTTPDANSPPCGASIRMRSSWTAPTRARNG